MSTATYVYFGVVATLVVFMVVLEARDRARYRRNMARGKGK